MPLLHPTKFPLTHPRASVLPSPPLLSPCFAIKQQHGEEGVGLGQEERQSVHVCVCVCALFWGGGGRATQNLTPTSFSFLESEGRELWLFYLSCHLGVYAFESISSLCVFLAPWSESIDGCGGERGHEHLSNPSETKGKQDKHTL